MNHNANDTKLNDSPAKNLKARHLSLKEKEPHIRARNAAKRLGVSEGELLACRVGENVIRLTDDAESILRAVCPLGEVMALTRNESCVHERKGVYDNCEFSKHGKMVIGLFVNPDIDLRLFMSHWTYCFAAIEETKMGKRKSLQFFDKEGQALHKIYLTANSNEKEYDRLVETHRHKSQDRWIEVKPYEPKAKERADDDINWKGLREAWEGLKDTHDFYPMLLKFKVGRQQALRHIGEDFAYEVDNVSARKVLGEVRDRNCEMMIFVGNRGCIQIHTGPVKKLIEHKGWYNVLDPLFNLHLREGEIAHSWVVKKPTTDGIVTALEMFDKKGEIIATFFGKRKPGIPELTLWREIISKIPKKETSHRKSSHKETSHKEPSHKETSHKGAHYVA